MDEVVYWFWRQKGGLLVRSWSGERESLETLFQGVVEPEVWCRRITLFPELLSAEFSFSITRVNV